MSSELLPVLREALGLADSRLGGLIMWVLAGLIPLALTVVFFRWVAAESEAEDSGPADDVCYDK